MTDTALLTLSQWMSPSFPLGSFAYSHGLEQAVSEGAVHDGASMERWLDAVLRFGGGWSDAVILSVVLRGAEPHEMADFAAALAPTQERWIETRDQGAAFARTVRDIAGLDVEDAAIPVVVGVAARTLDLPVETVLMLYLSSFASNLVSAGVRFIPLGQSDGQSVLSRLHPVIAQIAQTASCASLDDLATSAFAGDVASARHEDLDVRIFKT
ncbi:urease accessory protein UreF [Celeribacter arenosi]